MKNLNKVLAMLVVFMMVVSTVAFAAFTDVAEDSTYNVAVKVGTELGLFTGYEDGSFKPEGEITRAEFAAIVVRMKGQEAQAEGAKSATMFTDVPADHWAAGYINIAVRLGVINGYGDGNFGPSDLVEYQDAITMMVRALGYEPAIGAAGYPTGYLTKAGDLGLTANVSGVNGVAINRGKVAQIVFNALDVPLMTQSGYGTFTQYVVNDGYSATNGQTNVKKTILSENHSIVKVQGNVKSSTISTAASETGTEKVSFYVSNALLNKYSVEGVKLLAEKTTYNMEVGESDASAYVGKKVIAFVHVNEFDGVKTIVSLYDAPVADSLEVALQDLDAGYPKYAGTFTYYNENGRKASITAYKSKTEKLVDVNNTPNDATDDVLTTVYTAPDVYVNGININDVSNKALYNDLTKMSGTITFALLDTTNTTADYDTIYIDAATAFVVDEVKTGTSTVKSKFGAVSKINYDVDNAKYEAVLYGADGAEADFADLEENDVLMVKYVKTTNAGKEIFEAQVIDNVVEGAVDGLAGVVGAITREVTIGGATYKVAIGAEANGAIKSSDEGKFYLDANDNVVYFDITSAVSKNYGYVINTAAPQAGNFLSGYQIQMLTKDNTVVVYDLYKRIRYNTASGLEVVTTATAANELAYSTIAALKNQVITYNVNSANEITAIFTAQNKSAIDDEKLGDYFTWDNGFGVADLTGFDPDDNSFGRYTIDEETVIFYVEDNSTPEKAKKTGEVVPLPVLEEDDMFKNAKLFNVDAEDYISCILITGTGSKIGTQSKNATFVLKVSESTDEDGNTVYTVTGYKNCEVVTYTVDNAAIVSNIVGQLVVPVYEVNGKVKNFAKVGDTIVADKSKYIKTIAAANFDKIDGNKLYSKDATDTDGNGKLDDYTEIAKIKSNANVYVYDTNKAASGRGHYEIDASGYIDWDDTLGLYYGTEAGEFGLSVDVVLFYTEAKYDALTSTYTDAGDVVDVLFIIK